MSSINVNAISNEAGTGAPNFPNGLSVNSNPFPTAGSPSNRNKIINGNFDIWQRGTSGTSGYVADRWITVAVGSTAAISQQSFVLGQTDVPNEPTYFHRNVVTSVSGASNLLALSHRVEGVRTFAGQTATLSFWAKADASKNIAVEFAQSFGTGGSPSATAGAIGVTTCSLTTSWQKFTVTASIPSISGKTIGTDGDDSFVINFWLDAGSDYNSRTNSLGQQSGTFDIAQVQLEAGDVATPFEHRSYGQELALCQRYYVRWQPKVNSGSTSYPAIGFGYAAGPGLCNYGISTPSTMRATPTVSFSGTIRAAHGNISAILNSVNTIYQASNSGFWINTNFTTSPFTAGQGGILYVENSTANYFEASAEL